MGDRTRSVRAGDTTTVGSWRARGLGAVAHPWSLLALVVLVANDAVFKPAFPGALTGKLSDVAGLVVFALVMATAVGVVVRDDDHVVRVATIATGTWFAVMKTVPAVAAATEHLAELVVPAASIVVDPTDLVALPALLLAVHCWRRRLAPRTWAIPVLLVASVWSLATSCDGRDWDGDVHVGDDGGFLVVLDEASQAVTLDASGELVEIGERPPRDELPPRDQSLEACLPGGPCIVGDGHDLLERGDGEVRLVVDMDEHRLAYASRQGGGCDPTYRGVTDVAANADGVVVVAHGIQGVSVRNAAGVWDTLRVGALPLADAGTPFEPRTGAWLLVAAGFTLATLPRSRGWGTAGAGSATVLAGAGVLLLVDRSWGFFAVPAAGVALVLAIVVLAQPRRRGGAWLGWTALAHGGAVLVAEGLLWGWSTGWIAQHPVVVALILGLVATVSGTSVAIGSTTGAWPMVLVPSPPVPTWAPPPPPPWDG